MSNRRDRLTISPESWTTPARHPPGRAEAEAEDRLCDLGEALILAAGLAGAGLGGVLLGGFGAGLGLLIGMMLGGSYVERSDED